MTAEKSTAYSVYATVVVVDVREDNLRLDFGEYFLARSFIDAYHWADKLGLNYEYIKICPGIPVSEVSTIVYYQPALKDSEWGDLLHSFEVYWSQERCAKDFPGREIIKYQMDDIEDPTFVDEVDYCGGL